MPCLETNSGKLLYYKTIKHFNTPGHAHFLTFSCLQRMPLLTNELWLSWLGRSVRKACLTHEFALWAYVFMPDHVHLLVKPQRETHDLSLFLKSIKNPISIRIAEELRANPTSLLSDLTVPCGKSGNVFRFWQSGPGYDKNIWSMETAIEKAEYCHRNPVKRGLVDSPDLWRWSSFRWLECNSRQDEPLQVDDWIE